MLHVYINIKHTSQNVYKYFSNINIHSIMISGLSSFFYRNKISLNRGILQPMFEFNRLLVQSRDVCMNCMYVCININIENIQISHSGNTCVQDDVVQICSCAYQKLSQVILNVTSLSKIAALHINHSYVNQSSQFWFSAAFRWPLPA